MRFLAIVMDFVLLHFTTFEPKVGQTSAIQKYTKFGKFEVLYSPHFTTFRDQTLEFY
jgi:hypothetical protein